MFEMALQMSWNESVLMQAVISQSLNNTDGAKLAACEAASNL